MKYFWVDKDNCNIDSGEWGISKEHATEISNLLLTLTNGEIKEEKIDVKKGAIA